MGTQAGITELPPEPETYLLDRPVTGSMVLGLMPPQPQPTASYAWLLESSGTAPYWSRFHARWFLRRCQGVSGDLTETAVLVASELVANAYAATTGLTAIPAMPVIEFSLRLFGDHLLIEVTDASPEIPVPNPARDASAEDGRGLAQVVDALSLEWGYFWHQGKKVVYSILPLTPEDN